MTSRNPRLAFLRSLSVLGLLLMAPLPRMGIAAETAAPPPPPPRLAVVISIDQLLPEYLVRFRPYFSAGGFVRLLDAGANFANAHHRHAATLTAPGHASILSGVHADIHGVTANDWLDRELWEMVNNVEDRQSPLVGLAPADASPALLGPKGGRSPRSFQAITVGDQLKQRNGSRSKVFAASNKDRSAILLGGRLADAAYWDENGVMVTSQYYRKELPEWVQRFNAERRVHGAYGRTWERLLEASVYDQVQGPDDAAGEVVGFGFSRTLPKVVNGGTPAVSPAFFTAFDNSPFSAEFLGEFAQRAIREEKLGRNQSTDLLCLGFSQIDSIGHNYGPDSHEVMDSVLRLDRVLAALFDCLEQEVGLQHCVIVLTADHGVCPLPERVLAQRADALAGRVPVASFDTAGRKALDDAFGPLTSPEYWFTRDNSGYHLRPSALASKGVSADAAALVLKQALQAFPVMASVFTRAEILAHSGEGDSVLAMTRRSYYPPRDRDVVYALKPYFLTRANTGTTHGTPYAYDTHVPLLWWGAGVPAGKRVEFVGIDAVAPTLSALLGVAAPPQAKGPRLF